MLEGTSQTGTVKYVYAGNLTSVYTRRYRVRAETGQRKRYRVEIWSRSGNTWISLRAFLVAGYSRMVIDFDPPVHPEALKEG